MTELHSLSSVKYIGQYWQICVSVKTPYVIKHNTYRGPSILTGAVLVRV